MLQGLSGSFFSFCSHQLKKVADRSDYCAHVRERDHEPCSKYCLLLRFSTGCKKKMSTHFLSVIVAAEIAWGDAGGKHGEGILATQKLPCKK